MKKQLHFQSIEAFICQAIFKKFITLMQFYQFSFIIENQNRSDIIIEMFVTSPSWSIPGKYPLSKELVTPSPCGYHPEKYNNTHSPSWKIGTDTRNKQNNNSSPGPGQYESDKSSIINKFGKFNRQINRKNQTNQNPAPNNYSPNYKCNRPSTPARTISIKPKQAKKSQVPGPGQYQASYCGKKSQINVKIGGQKRFLTQKLQGPGPQTYNPMKQTFKKVSIGFTKDDKKSCSSYQNEQIKVPGPGSYQIKDYFSNSLKQNRGYSISSKYNPTQTTQNPGPGQYDPKYVSQPQSPKVSMKGKHLNDKIENIPGPGQYVFYNGFKGDRHGYSIGKGNRTYTNSSKYNPGPGAYNPRSVFHESPKFSLYGSRFQEPKSSSPGPGAYNADKNVLKRRPQSAKIGNSKRCELDKPVNPGPGEYEAKTRPSTPCNSFTKQIRGKMTTELTPGPGHYEINQIFGQTQSYFKKT